MTTPEASDSRLPRFHQLSSAAEDALIDDQTWADLDMEAVFARIDRTRSDPGRMVLYRVLRSPMDSIERLSERDALIGELDPEGETGRVLRDELGRLNRTAGAGDLMLLLWDEPPEGLPHAGVHRVLALLAVATVPLALAIGGPAVFAPLLVFAVNTFVHFRTRTRWQRELQALRFLGSLRDCARRVARVPAPPLEGHQHRLVKALDDTASAARRVALVSSGALRDILYEYVSVFLLLEPRAYQWLVRHWEETAPPAREIFSALGELDALASVAQWRAELFTWCRPDLEPGPPHLQVDEGVHPLLDDPVPNSLSLSTRGCLVTGANMSGKSTFLRTLGINALFAQTVFTCTARGYRASPLRVVSSMRVGDDVLAGKSRYLAEAERLLTLVRQSDSGSPALLLIDELLSGTNVAERVAASRAILDHLARRNPLVVVATHDQELASHLRGRYDAVFFADGLTRGDLRFDHRLQAGVAVTGNALRLLEHLGYPEEILSEARGQSR